MATNVNKKRLRVTELDFDQIKENLKLFLKAQDEFKDYDFDGSGMNILLDTLAYNTHYLGYNVNMLANEMFLDSASLRSSIVSHAKQLGYEVGSARILQKQFLVYQLKQVRQQLQCSLQVQSLVQHLMVILIIL